MTETPALLAHSLRVATIINKLCFIVGFTLKFSSVQFNSCSDGSTQQSVSERKLQQSGDPL